VHSNKLENNKWTVITAKHHRKGFLQRISLRLIIYTLSLHLTVISIAIKRKILRRMFGPSKENQMWRIKTN
jgi:hypothetical protein